MTYFWSKDTPNALDNKSGRYSGVCLLSLPSIICMPVKIALCIERSLQNFSVVSTNQSKLTQSGSNVDNISVIFLYSSSLILLFVLISIDKDSFVGRLLYLFTNLYISVNNIFSNLSEKYSSLIK